MDTEFKREERYIVLKRKNLYPEQESAIRDLLEEMGILTVECVVVESDWPESETVWQMIQDRIEGRTNELTAANERITWLEADVDRLNRAWASAHNQAMKNGAALTVEREVSDKLEKALSEIVREGDLTAPEGMKRTARAALAKVSAIRATHTSAEQA